MSSRQFPTRTLRRTTQALALLTAISIPTVGVAASLDKPATAHSPSAAAAASGDDRAFVESLRQQDLAKKSELANAFFSRMQTIEKQQRASRSQQRTSVTVAPAVTAPAPAAKSFTRPTSGPLTQPFGSHPGIDIAPPYGTPVVAATSGIVTFTGVQDGYGNHVEVLHPDGTVTTYSHLSAITVRVGQPVATGQQLGNVGSTGNSTGPHLHFEVHINGQRVDPLGWLIAHGAW